MDAAAVRNEALSSLGSFSPSAPSAFSACNAATARAAVDFSLLVGELGDDTELEWLSMVADRKGKLIGSGQQITLAIGT